MDTGWKDIWHGIRERKHDGAEILLTGVPCTQRNEEMILWLVLSRMPKKGLLCVLFFFFCVRETLAMLIIPYLDCVFKNSYSTSSWYQVQQSNNASFWFRAITDTVRHCTCEISEDLLRICTVCMGILNVCATCVTTGSNFAVHMQRSLTWITPIEDSPKVYKFLWVLARKSTNWMLDNG